MNDAPVLAPPNFTVVEDIAQTLNLLGTAIDVEGDALTVQVITQPTKGTLVQNAQGPCTYMPAANANGPETFNYRASDGTLQSGIVTAALQITPVNDAPVATADATSTQRNTSVRIAVLANDTYVESTFWTGKKVQPKNSFVPSDTIFAFVN